MRRIIHNPTLQKTSLLALLTVILSGCALFVPEPATEPVKKIPEIVPEIVPPKPESTAERPAKKKKVTGPTKKTQPRVAIVTSAKTPAYENVATELGKLLENYSSFNLADTSITPEGVFSAIDEGQTNVVVAIGLRAATEAKSRSTVPVVFCQVFNFEDNDLLSENVKGIAAIPPLDLQVEAWRQLDPGLNNIGAILGPGHEYLISEATRATDSAEIQLHYRMANSDREALFVFNRLIPHIDGFWLFPDNRVLSATVLRQMMEYALRHNVQVAVFNRPLLDMGATISTTAVDSDIATTVVSVINHLVNDDPESIPSITPLSQIDIQTNKSKLDSLGKRTSNVFHKSGKDGAP